MEKLFESLQPGLPPWLVPPGAIILLFLIAWPALREIWTGVIPSYRKYAREKRRLELLKLYYEVEAIKKDHQLSELPPIASDTLTALVQTARNVSDASARPYDKELATISRPRKFLFGALGGAAVFLFGALPDFYVGMFGLVGVDVVELVVLTGLISRGVVLILVGGVTALATNPKTPADAFIRGMVAPLLISLLLSFSTWYYLRDYISSAAWLYPHWWA